MDKKMSFAILKEAETREKLRKWWESLEDDPGSRARLRRAEQPDDALLTEPFFQFLHQMPSEWSKPANLAASALVAVALAHVKEPRDGQSFAAQLAAPREMGEKPRVSELRFQQLQKSRDPDEFFRRLLRAIRLAENRVNLFSLADGILLWMKEYRFGIDREPQKRLAVSWASDYYMALSRTENQPRSKGGKKS